MANRVVLNHQDNEKILKSDEVMAACRKIGDAIHDGTGRPDDYEVQEFVGEHRARVTVRTVDDRHARAREARDHLLIFALTAAQVA